MPTDDLNGRFSAVANAADRYSLWSECAEIPAGWTVSSGVADRSYRIEYVSTNWSDVRPPGLVARLARAASSEQESAR
ncbi:MbtH family NRPS accessory protein [Streptomyces sp. C10]|uniref:MbtH family NRPS accessory protein n=1 Tax=Streptomyces sp. C10 TaxID=531941 RepID=UPI003980912C